MSPNAIGRDILLWSFLVMGTINAGQAADLAEAALTATCPNPGTYKDRALDLDGKTIANSAPVWRLDPGDPMPALTYKVADVKYGLSDFLKKTKVTGLIVLHRSKVVKEIYCTGYSRTSRFNIQSITKSIMSTLIAIMFKEHPQYTVATTGAIASSLSGSAYEKVPLSSILQMSSGAEFDDHDDMSRFFGFFAKLLGHASLESKVKSQKPVRPHGTKFQYSGIDISALGMILAAITKKKNADYLEEKIWKPLGMEAPAEWKHDNTDQKRELPFCCLYATLRDVSRFGLLIANDGIWDGKRLLPEGWVRKATQPDSPHVMPGPGGTGYSIGYQYQWWTGPDPVDAFYGQGIHGQNLYIDPQAGIVAVVSSQWPDPEVKEYYSHTFKFMRAISRHYRGQ